MVNLDVRYVCLLSIHTLYHVCQLVSIIEGCHGCTYDSITYRRQNNRLDSTRPGAKENESIYYFCDDKGSDKPRTTAIAINRGLVQQLCQLGTESEEVLLILKNACKKRLEQFTTLQEAQNVLGNLFSRDAVRNKTTFVVLDALDESVDRSRIL